MAEALARTQNDTITIRLTHDEKMAIGKRMLEAASPSLRRFVLDMCLHGKVIVNEDLRALNAELRREGNNLNQIVRLAHQGKIKVVYLDETLACYKKVLELLGGNDGGR